MNVCIITVYNTENCGSFWQAYALADAIKKTGHNVFFLRRNLSDTSQSVSMRLKNSLAKSVKLDFKSALLLWKRYFDYKEAQKCFEVIDEKSVDYNNIDLFVLGSDTIWNFNSHYFMKHKRRYTGGQFLPKPSITYAASAANTPLSVFKSDSIIKSDIEALKAISVRDEETYSIVKELTGKETSVVCDPTMLVSRDVFDKNTQEIGDRNYMLLYHFALISESVKNEILKLKKKHGLKVISFGEYRSWCDKNVPYDPYLFVSYFKNASFVVTDTFHGTIFSVLYEKNFAEYGNNKKKIADLLKTLHLTDAVKENDASLTDMFESGLDYGFANEEIKRIRGASMNYLKENLSEN